MRRSSLRLTRRLSAGSSSLSSWTPVTPGRPRETSRVLWFGMRTTLLCSSSCGPFSIELVSGSDFLEDDMVTDGRRHRRGWIGGRGERGGGGEKDGS